MADWGAQLIEWNLNRLKGMHDRTIKALREMGDEDVNWKPNPESNSAVNLIIHTAASLWSLSSRCGGGTGNLDRTAEFGAHAPRTRADMVSIIDEAYGAAEAAVGAVNSAKLESTVDMYGRQVTVGEAILNGVAHANEHLGQILYIAKQRLGAGYTVQRGTPRK